MDPCSHKLVRLLNATCYSKQPQNIRGSPPGKFISHLYHRTTEFWMALLELVTHHVAFAFSDSFACRRWRMKGYGKRHKHLRSGFQIVYMAFSQIPLARTWSQYPTQKQRDRNLGFLYSQEKETRLECI